MVITTADKKTVVEFPSAVDADEAFFTELKFRILAERAKEETKWFSFTRQKIQSAAYQQILSMGDTVIPYMLKYLDLHPVLWFHALRTLTGENAVPSEHAGNVELMKQDWLLWGKKKNLI